MCKVWNRSHIPSRELTLEGFLDQNFIPQSKIEDLMKPRPSGTVLLCTHKLTFNSLRKKSGGCLGFLAGHSAEKTAKYSSSLQRIKLGNDSDVYRGSAFAEFSSSSSFCIQLLVHSWEELISAIAFMLNSLENVKANQTLSNLYAIQTPEGWSQICHYIRWRIWIILNSHLTVESFVGMSAFSIDRLQF